MSVIFLQFNANYPPMEESEIHIKERKFKVTHFRDKNKANIIKHHMQDNEVNISFLSTVKALALALSLSLSLSLSFFLFLNIKHIK